VKVQWLNASIRLRITPTELWGLVRGLQLGQTLEFPGGACWSVRVLPNCRDADLVWCGDALCVCLTEGDVAALAEGDTEIVHFTTGGSRAIRYLVERDVPCAPPHEVEAAEPKPRGFGRLAGSRRRRRLGRERGPRTTVLPG
jgi:hypothetical protein